MMTMDPAKLSEYLKAQRWFGGKAWPIKSVAVVDQAPLPGDAPEGSEAILAIVEVLYELGTPERYLLAMTPTVHGDVSEALGGDRFAHAVLKMIRDGSQVSAGSGVLKGERLSENERLFQSLPEEPSVRRLETEQSNTCIVLGDKVILKVIRKLEAGLNPEYEMGQFLTRRGFAHSPAFLGALQLEGQAAATVALLHEFIPQARTGWECVLDFFRQGQRLDASARTSLLELGRSIGQLHRVLASDFEDAAFAPEPVQLEDLQRWSSSIIGELGVTLADASERFPHALNQREQIVARARKLAHLHPSGMKIRIHGDLHLGQVLRSGNRWLVFDFEGEPARRFAQRREKQSPLKDVAGMMRSFSYAATTVALEGRLAKEHLLAARTAFLEGYEQATQGLGLLPSDAVDWKGMLEAFELEKLLYEVRYELHNRPDWARIPIEALMHPETAR